MAMTLSQPDGEGGCKCGCTCPDGDYQITLAMLLICGCLSNGGGAVFSSVAWDVSMVLDGVYVITMTNGDGFISLGTNNPLQYVPPACAGTGVNPIVPINTTLALHCEGELFSLRALFNAESSILSVTRYAALFLARTLTLGVSVDNECVTCDTDLPSDPVFSLIPFVSGTGGTALVEAL